MSKRLIRQITVILIILGIIGTIVFFIWYINRPEEAEPTPSPPSPEYTEISTGEARLLQNDTAWDYIIDIENLNDDWVLAGFSYELQLDGETISGSRGSDYLRESETKFLIITRLELTDGTLLPEIVFADLDWVEVDQNLGKTDLVIKSYDPTESYVASGKKNELTGIVQNRTDYDLADIDIYVKVFDREENLIAVNRSSVGPVTISEQKQFNMEWSNSEINNTSTFEIIATTNFYNETNILDSGGVSRQGE